MSSCGCSKNDETYISCGTPSYNNTCPIKYDCGEPCARVEEKKQSVSKKEKNECAYKNGEFRHSLGNYSRSAYHNKPCCHKH